MRKSSFLILVINVISIVIGLILLRDNAELVANYAIDNNHHIPLSKFNLLLIGLVPFIVVFTMDLIATIEADEVKPFIRYYDRLKYVICFGFQLLYILIVASQLMPMNEKYIVGLIVSGVIFYGGYTLPKITPNQVFGFKNKWTLSDAQIWTKVHKRASYLSYLIGIVVLALTFSKQLVVAGAVVVMIVFSLLYLIRYSYILSKK